MSKPVTKVDQKLLARAIERAEEDGPLRNLSELWKAASQIYNELVGDKDLKPISPSVVYLRAGEWKLPYVTKAGKKGRQGPMSEEYKAAMAAARAAGGGRKSKAEKFAADPAKVAWIKRLRETVPSRFQPLVDQVEGGSRSAAVKLHCLECSAFVTSEVRQCVCNQCPLFGFRPYQGAVELDEDIEVETEELELEAAVA